MKRNWARIAIGLLVVSCATKATKGLLEGDVPMGTLTKEGDLGFGRFSFPSREIPMPSGLRVAYETAPSRGMVSVILALDVGSTLDPQQKEGLAHYAEHLVFRNRPRGVELGLEFQRMAATYNASTTLDATTFYALAPAPSLPALIEAMAGLLQKPLQAVTAEDAAVELDVVRSEFALKNETGVYGQLRGWMQTLLIEASHPYRRPTSGSADSLKRLTLADARSFVDSHYKPDKATLLVVGDVDGEKLGELLKQKLPPALLGDASNPVTREVGPVPLLNVVVPKEPDAPPRHQAAVALPELWVGYLMPGKFSQNVGNTRLIASSATEMRLRELVGADPDVVTVNLVPLHDRMATILAIQVVLTSDKRRDEIAEKVRQSMNWMWRPLHPQFAKVLASIAQVSPVRLGNQYVFFRPTADYYLQAQGEHLARMRFKGIAEAIGGLEPWTERALERAGYLQVMGQPGSLMWATHQATLMGEQSVSEFSSQFLTPERARVAYVDPLPADRRPKPGRVGVSDRPIVDEKMQAVQFGEPFVSPPPPELASTRQVRLENGLTVAIVRRAGFPAVSAALAFGGGAVASDPPGAVDLIRRFESLAGISMPFNAVEAMPIDGPSYTGDLVRAGTRNLSNALFLLAQRIVDTDKTDWAVMDREDDKNSTLVFRVTPGQKAGHLLRQSLYGDHPLAQPPPGPEVLDIRGEHMERWIPRMRTPRNAFLVIVGDVELNEGERLARTWFGSWQGQKEAVPATLPPVPAPTSRPRGIDAAPIVVDRDGETQVELVFACRLPPADARARARYQLMSSVLGAYINTMVRFRAGAAYAISTQTNFRGGGAADVLITMDLETRRIPEALTAMRSLWTRLGTEGFDPGAVSQARWAVSTGYNLRYETASELAFTLVENWSLGWPLDSLTRYPEELRAATAADLNTVFKTCRDSTVSIVLGEKKAVDPVLANGR